MYLFKLPYLRASYDVEKMTVWEGMYIIIVTKQYTDAIMSHVI